jgi:SIR2-like domain
MSPVSFESTARLAERVLDGEVVFFVGSGFSIDSEGNDARRLVGRLLAGLLGLGATLAGANTGPSNPPSELLDGLGRVFSLEGASKSGEAAHAPARCMTVANLQALAREYYSFNDWCVSALGALSAGLVVEDVPSDPGKSKARRELQADLAKRAWQLGNYLLGLLGDKIPFDDPFASHVLSAFASPAARGKALFLDLMGFASSDIMAGTPRQRDEGLLAKSYGERLRPRHHVLARLAREGLAPMMVTTNYDLLLEGAYRIAGFVERDVALDTTGPDAARFSRIAGVQNFFARGAGYRTALLLKIHGCAEAYRDGRTARLRWLALQKEGEAARSAEPDAWSAYLPSLVFTYREIQTWRGDAWSRDLIRTLLRTHTIALCGYSGADPIMHSTFREVYEEQAAARGGPKTASPSQPCNAEDAAAFFFGVAEKREFHALEILRAATAAAGLGEVNLVEHPNNIEFAFAPKFPAIDDHFRWLMHRVVRGLQRSALQTRLRTLMARLLGHKCRDEELALALAAFDRVCAEEEKLAAEVCAPTSKLPVGERRARFDRIVGWTWYFVPGLLRELKLADAGDAERGGGQRLSRRGPSSHYQPIAEHPEWAAWAAILELGLRKLFAVLELPAERVVVEESPYAAVSFPRSANEFAPAALCMRLSNIERPGRAPALNGAFRNVKYWEFGDGEAPWPIQSRDGSPASNLIWPWAWGGKSPTPTAAKGYLGL